MSKSAAVLTALGVLTGEIQANALKSPTLFWTEAGTRLSSSRMIFRDDLSPRTRSAVANHVFSETEEANYKALTVDHVVRNDERLLYSSSEKSVYLGRYEFFNEGEHNFTETEWAAQVTGIKANCDNGKIYMAAVDRILMSDDYFINVEPLYNVTDGRHIGALFPDPVTESIYFSTYAPCPGMCGKISAPRDKPAKIFRCEMGFTNFDTQCTQLYESPPDCYTQIDGITIAYEKTEGPEITARLYFTHNNYWTNYSSALMSMDLDGKNLFKHFEKKNSRMYDVVYTSNWLFTTDHFKAMWGAEPFKIWVTAALYNPSMIQLDTNQTHDYFQVPKYTLSWFYKTTNQPFSIDVYNPEEFDVLRNLVDSADADMEMTVVPDPEPESEPEAEPEVEPEAEPEAAPQAEPESTTKPEAPPKTTPKPETVTVAFTEPAITEPLPEAATMAPALPVTTKAVKSDDIDSNDFSSEPEPETTTKATQPEKDETTTESEADLLRKIMEAIAKKQKEEKEEDEALERLMDEDAGRDKKVVELVSTYTVDPALTKPVTKDNDVDITAATSLEDATDEEDTSTESPPKEILKTESTVAKIEDKLAVIHRDGSHPYDVIEKSVETKTCQSTADICNSHRVQYLERFRNSENRMTNIELRATKIEIRLFNLEKENLRKEAERIAVTSTMKLETTVSNILKNVDGKGQSLMDGLKLVAEIREESARLEAILQEILRKTGDVEGDD